MIIIYSFLGVMFVYFIYMCIKLKDFNSLYVGQDVLIKVYKEDDMFYWVRDNIATTYKYYAVTEKGYEIYFEDVLFRKVIINKNNNE